MPTPPFRFSIRLIPRGLSMSKNRKRMKASIIWYILSGNAARRTIQTPTISSTTTFDGSFPHSDSRAFAEIIPKIVNTRIRIIVVIRSWSGEVIKDSPTQASVANSAPAVPGAMGENPLPRPVAIIM